MFSLPLSHDDFKYGSVAPLTPFLLTVSVPPAPRPWDARLGLLTIWVSFQLLSSSPCDGREEFLQSNDVIGFLVIEAAFGSLRSYPPHYSLACRCVAMPGGTESALSVEFGS